MNALVRQLAVLSVLWAVCEMILPGGRRQQMIRMTLGVLVMTSLFTAMGDAATQARVIPSAPAFSAAAAQAAQSSYQRTALRAAANQIRAYCEKVLQRAGYTGEALVTLGMDGSIREIRLTLTASPSPLLTGSELAEKLAEALDADPAVIRLLPPS